MRIMTHENFYFNRLMLSLIFGIQASETSLRPGERLKSPGLIGLRLLRDTLVDSCGLGCSNGERFWRSVIFLLKIPYLPEGQLVCP